MTSIYNTYNRPNFAFRCGRGGQWQKPCANGPNPDGSCGGVAVCRPTKSGDRWSCKRSRDEGGACDLGPLSNGECCLTQPACKPLPTLRVQRFRLSAIAALLVVALIGGLGLTGGLFSDLEPPFRDAGQLSPKHASIVGDNSCTDCHDNHGDGPIQMVKAVFDPSGTDGMTSKCLDCHTFPDEATSVHQAGTCNSCHAEHKGTDKALVKFVDGQCHACHEQKFSTFASSHPQFGDNYPHRRRTSINFDHNSHINTHFQDAQFSDVAPKDGCVSCHEVGSAGKAVPVKSFNENCSGCHQEQISSASLNLFTVPEFEENPFDRDAVEELCSVEEDAEEEEDTEEREDSSSEPKEEDEEDEEAEEYESVSAETLNEITAALLEVDPENIEEYQEKIGSLLVSLAENGAVPISELLEEIDAPANLLLSGLNADLVKLGVCAWISNKEFEPIDEGSNGGWRVEELAVTYTAKNHSDQVLKSWYDFVAEAEDDLLSEYLLKSDGPGTCVSCHSVNDTGTIDIAWKAGARSSNKLHKYNHGPHLNVLGPGSQCGTCHVIDKVAEYAASFEQNDPTEFESNFLSIKTETCKECHNKQAATQDCRTCHEYHENAIFKGKMIFNKNNNRKSVSLN